MQESVGVEKTSVTSGRRCAALYKKSGPLGSLVRTLLESPQWSKEGFSLKWERKRLYSSRKTSFTDTNLSNPSPSNASAKTSKPSDTKSSRCLFRLRLVGLPIDETECFSSPIMLKTPTTMDAASENMKSKGVSGCSGTLAQEIAQGYAQKRGLMLPTPETQGLKVNEGGKQKFIRLDLLPTPTAGEGDKWTNTYNPNSQMGRSLSAMAACAMLPTPRVGGQENYETRVKRKGHVVAMSYLESAVDFLTWKGILPTPSARDTIGQLTEGSSPKKDGGSFRLSPLFTEEMMGFPLMWTALPFLQYQLPQPMEKETPKNTHFPNGEPKPSKPTAMPLSRK